MLDTRSLECALTPMVGRFKVVFEMDVEREVLRVLDDVLSLRGRSSSFTRATHLLGAIPELDSMAVVALITSIEERFGISIGDDEIDGQTFSTVGALSDFIGAKVSPAVS